MSETSSCSRHPLTVVAALAAAAVLVVSAANLARGEVKVSPRLTLDGGDRYGEMGTAGELPAWIPLMKPSEAVEKEEQVRGRGLL